MSRDLHKMYAYAQNVFLYTALRNLRDPVYPAGSSTRHALMLHVHAERLHAAVRRNCLA